MRREGQLGRTDHEDGAVGVAAADVAFCAGKCDANKKHLKKGAHAHSVKEQAERVRMVK